MTVTVRQTTGASHDIAIDVATATVLDLKIKVQELLHCPPEAQRLIFQGRVLDEKATLASYSLADGLTVHLAINTKLMPAAVPAPTTTPASVAASIPTPATPVSPLVTLLPLLKQTPAGIAALGTLRKMAENIVNHPSEEKYRKIRVANEALKKKVLDVPHGLACVHAMGFAPGVEEGHLVLVPTAANWEQLVAAKRLLDQASTPASAFTPAAAPGFQPTAGSSDPLSDMLRNPMLASMLQSDPRIQQMAQSNPLLQQALENPAILQQALGAVQSNPMMRQQMQQMMGNPQLMQQMMQGGGFPNAFGMPPATPAASTPAASPFGAPVSLASMPPVPTVSVPTTPTPPSAVRSEEDEIAEAIARSLREM
ncbi:ubiquitin family protein [Achlya hypogyna]|uniref:Ubiquitin family protein n=1 Tax=Achlya hypogyna TaxID=1202772 RepID=A0A1V9Z472_ACHHY|nr:ubiquitin family protein [Achlya hypogyna]